MSINEMAKYWLASRLLNGSENSLRVKEYRELGMGAYEAGANAVLDEVCKTISVSENGYLESNLKKLIKELKGGAE